tara:strand:- start:357 stop:719 length:363 start_codon:yes stop_codon:yes gene_type:complete
MDNYTKAVGDSMLAMSKQMAKLYENTGLEPQKFAEAMQKMMPEAPKVNFNKNGYEIRAQMLEMAQNQMWQDYHAKWGAFETSVNKEDKEVVVKVEMPTVPGADVVLETAEKFYNFVNGKK